MKTKTILPIILMLFVYSCSLFEDSEPTKSESEFRLVEQNYYVGDKLKVFDYIYNDSGQLISRGDYRYVYAGNVVFVDNGTYFKKYIFNDSNQLIEFWSGKYANYYEYSGDNLKKFTAHAADGSVRFVCEYTYSDRRLIKQVCSDRIVDYFYNADTLKVMDTVSALNDAVFKNAFYYDDSYLTEIGGWGKYNDPDNTYYWYDENRNLVLRTTSINDKGVVYKYEQKVGNAHLFKRPEEELMLRMY